MNERRRAPRFDVTAPGRLHLAGGRSADVVLRNVGELGALVSIEDLELTIAEGERALLEHPAFLDGRITDRHVRTAAAVVRVELDLDGEGVARQVALHFDGGPRPEGLGAPS
jgi:hypothetical protein